MGGDGLPAAARSHVGEDEEVVWWARPSAWGLVPAAAAALAGAAMGLAALVGFASAGGGPASYAWWLLGLTGLSFLGWAGDRAQAVLFTTYVVTDERIVSVRSLFSTSATSVPLRQVSRVRLGWGVLEGLLGLESARVSSYGASGTRIGIPSVDKGRGLSGALVEAQGRGSSADWLVRSD